MKFGYNEVLEVSVFDKDGSLVTTLDTLKSSSIHLSENGIFRLIIKDALIDDKLLKFLGREEKDESTDFEKYLKKQKYGTTIAFGRSIEKFCKLIGRGVLREVSTKKDKEFIFEIPNGITGKDLNITKEYDNENPSDFGFVFEARPFNDEKDQIRIHIE